jgi:hypothetical protein
VAKLEAAGLAGRRRAPSTTSIKKIVLQIGPQDGPAMPWLDLTVEQAAPAASGSEGGTIVMDQEHEPWGARITLERDTKVAPAAITCGLYGWMFHTRYFADLELAQREYEGMKADLSKLVSLVPFENDPNVRAKRATLTAAISEFVERYPT